MSQGTAPQVCHDIINFWLASSNYWFDRCENFDLRFKNKYEKLHWQAASRAFHHWVESDEGALALLILLDQYPRNSFRNTGHMYATDSLALSYARQLVARKGDMNLEQSLRVFCYLPFAHSESLADQDLAVSLNERGQTGRGLEFAIHHREIIKQFGRFPHRNAILGRDSSTAELEYLAEGGFQG